ncbi:MarR family winged helix-turn-helix transcriptional regulator [Salidesulfovibrio onnuriiensis]|uniref:MarR family winged helix-turn-helix transcriptional regulator n=1 Tax=Salidesulfovibrio onnuriiensis TaxID=2583823 RepID=UPI00202B133F|nr:MarR family transcriptional regulator [Salidesulfovibrio onnuriiensis]
MKNEFRTLGDALEKYVQISKLPFDFGVGIQIYPSEIHTVAALCEQGNMSITELARSSGVSKAAMSQLVSKLEKKGLVHREISPDNQSKQNVRPTELGRKAQEGHMKYHMEHDSEFFTYVAALPDTEYAVFKKFCRQMDRWMDNYLS